eukprot:g5065.t1
MATAPGSLCRDQAHTSSAAARHIFDGEAKEQPKTKPDVQITAAFGLRECPKVLELLSHEELPVRRQALLVLCELFRLPEKVALSLRAGAVSQLLRLAKDEDDTTRKRATLGLCALARDANGKEALLSCDACGVCVSCLRDPNMDVRCNAYDTLLLLSRSLRGVEVVCGTDCVELLVAKAAEEVDEVKPRTLRLLYQVLDQKSGGAMQAAQRQGAVDVCTRLLDSDAAEVREGSASALSKLSINEAGKQFAIKAGCVATLCALLADSTWRVRSHAAAALMTIAIDDDGKRAAIAAGGVERLIKLLKDRERLVKLSALKAIATVSAHPEARQRFVQSKQCVDALAVLASDDDAVLCRTARIAKEVVEWTP